MLDLQGKAIRGIAAGIGLASESISAYKANKQEKKKQPQTTDSTAETERLADEQLEEEWGLDEAQDELHAGGHQENPGSDSTTTVDELTDAFLRDLPPPYSATEYSETPSRPKLPYPVVLPQRRPKDKKRGFIRAYAPVLEEFGIDQAMFLNFLETANAACQATPWLYALNLASIGTMWIPGAMSFVVSVIIQIGTNAAIAVEGRRKTNTFFDKINEEFFRPRGLFCLIMTWDSESSSTFSRFDLNTAISTAVDHGGPGKLNKLRHTFKSSDGKSHGELPFPEVAPLVFPGLDAVAATGSQSKVKSLKKRDFVADYFDRRSQAEFTMENPSSALNVAPTPAFTSRYADPNHPASSGDLLALVSGGRITSDILPSRQILAATDRGPRLGGRLGSGPGGNIGLRDLPGGNIIHAVRSRRGGPQYADRVTDSDIDQTVHSRRDRDRGHGRGRGGGSRSQHDGPLAMIPGVQGVKKLFKSNVVYLMIVDMPSEEEMAAARAMFDK
ncbi:hypothetical protein BDW59DRAFT_138721 [Aspergillus cavernicola]|uniref:Uncharacterized protein n=1 Tax=Aspergillus cavernicola TaxID=176166 RepID=A0ABR4IZ33_9EURO